MPMTAYAACPKSIAGSYVTYGAKSNPDSANAQAALATFGPIPRGGYGAVSFDKAAYSEVDGNGSLSGKYFSETISVGRYYYDGKCFGYFWTATSGSGGATLDLNFLYVSDGGAQIVVTFGPRGVAKDSAGNPLGIPNEWSDGGNPGFSILRKQ